MFIFKHWDLFVNESLKVYNSKFVFSFEHQEYQIPFSKAATMLFRFSCVLFASFLSPNSFEFPPIGKKVSAFRIKGEPM